jgi:uncharacterized phage-associated protein
MVSEWRVGGVCRVAYEEQRSQGREAMKLELESAWGSSTQSNTPSERLVSSNSRNQTTHSHA